MTLPDYVLAKTGCVMWPKSGVIELQNVANIPKPSGHSIQGFLLEWCLVGMASAECVPIF